MTEAREDDFDEDYGPDVETAPYWYPGQTLPAEAQRIGLSHHVPDGALLDFAGRLDSTRPFHRAVAWVMLAVFGTPVVLYIVRLAIDVAHAWGRG
jgi:hypothetical protein